MNGIGNLIKAEAARLGFSFLRITHTGQPPHFAAYKRWAASGNAGAMRYLESDKTLKSRSNPAGLLDQAKSMLVFGLCYAPLTQALTQKEDNPDRPHGRIASYAAYADYHTVLKQAAHLLMSRIKQKTGTDIHYRIFVDSSGLLEKDTAFMAGAGWIGRNSLLITPEYGSFQVLGCILTDLQLTPDEVFSTDLCGNCQKCQRACPTQCITDEHTLHAEDCIAYLTIEYKGIIPRRLRSKMGPWVFGCDVCQNVCPWNSKAIDQPVKGSGMLARKLDTAVDLLAEIQLDEGAFQAKYRGSPILRATHTSFQRNLIIAMGNSQSPACAPALINILHQNPAWLLRLHAAWALTAIHPADLPRILTQALAAESDERVRNELQTSLTELTE